MTLLIYIRSISFSWAVLYSVESTKKKEHLLIYIHLLPLIPWPHSLEYMKPKNATNKNPTQCTWAKKNETTIWNPNTNLKKKNIYIYLWYIFFVPCLFSCWHLLFMAIRVFSCWAFFSNHLLQTKCRCYFYFVVTLTFWIFNLLVSFPNDPSASLPFCSVAYIILSLLWNTLSFFLDASFISNNFLCWIYFITNFVICKSILFLIVLFLWWFFLLILFSYVRFFCFGISFMLILFFSQFSSRFVSCSLRRWSILFVIFFYLPKTAASSLFMSS